MGEGWVARMEIAVNGAELQIIDFTFGSTRNLWYLCCRYECKEYDDTEYRLKIDHFSTHTFQKTMGRHVVEMAGDKSEMVLIKLSDKCIKT